MKKILLLLILSFVCLFSVVACGDDTDKTTTPETPVGPQLSDELRSAQSYLKQMYEKAAESTPADYVRPGKAAKCSVVWTVEVTSGNAEDIKVVQNEDGTYTIDVNEMASADATYVLTATITDTAGNTTTLVYNHKLPKFKELSYAEYAAKEKGDPVVVKGIVVGILSKDYGDSVNALYLHTEEGGFYIYGMEENPKGKYEMGMEVRATGEFDNYNGTLEVKNATCEILNATPVAVTPVDLTEAYKAAEDLKAESILGKQSMLVTLKGVTIGGAGDNGYYYFELDGLKTYMRVSSSTCPLNAEDTTAFTEGWLDHVGWTANVTGVVSIYSGNFYLQPCDANAVEYVSLPELSDAEAVAWAKENLDTEVRFVNGKETELPLLSSSYDVTQTWSSSNTDVIAISEEGIATVTAATEDTTVTISVVLSKGSASETVTFEVTIKGVPVGAPTRVELTVDTLGLGAYGVGETTVGGVGFQWTELGSYGDGIQMRIKNGNTAKLWNTTALPVIESIEFIYSSTKDVAYSNENMLSIKYGNAADALTNEVKLSTVASQKEYTITLSGDATFISLELLDAHTYYWDAIKINYKKVETQNPVELTVDALGLEAYSASETTVDGIGFQWIELGSYGDGIQMRIKNGNTATIWNTTAFAANVSEIRFVYSSTKDVAYSNANMLSIKYGNAVDALTNEVKLSTVAGQKEYTVTLSGDATFIRLELLDAHTYYWDSITFAFGDSAVTPDPEPTPTPDPEPTPTPDPEPTPEPDQGDIVVNPVADKEYYLSFTQTKKNAEYYFIGTMNKYYGATSTDITAAVKVVLVAVDGGFNIKFELNGATKYINTEVSGTHLNFVIGDTAQSVWAWNAELNTLTALCGTETVYMGTYGDYNTFGVSKLSTAATSYVAHLTEVGGSETPEPEPTPEPTPTPDPNPGEEKVNYADFETMGASSSSYAVRTSAAGWTAENCALNAGGSSDSNPNFKVFGTSEDRALTLNGKVSAPGKVLSPVLTGGIKKLTFNYCQLFTDKQFSATVSIKDASGNVVATKNVEFSSNGTTADKYIVYEFVFELETAVTGEFQIEIVNNCPTQNTGNKDRLSIWNLSWVSAE